MPDFHFLQTHTQFYTSTTPIIQIFGIDTHSHPIELHVTNFLPYFYIQIPDLPSPSQPFLATLKSTFNDHYKKATLIDITLVEKQSIYGYTSTKSTFLKLSFNNQNLNNIKTYLEGGLVINKKKYFFKFYESNLSYVMRFLIDKGIGGMSYIRIQNYTQTHSHPTRTLTVDHNDVFGVEQTGQFMLLPKFKILSFDIECIGKGDSFPNSKHDPVIQIGNTFSKDNVVVKDIFCLKECAPIPGATVHCYEKERDLLIGWYKYLHSKDPDIITGYNIKNFDFPYLIERGKELKIDYFSVLGRTNKATEVRENVFSNRAIGSRASKDVDIEGRLIFDMFSIIRKDYNLRSYTLNSVSVHFLGEQKEDVPYNMMRSLQEGDKESRKRIATYCLTDTYLPLRLFNTLNVLANYTEMARVTGVPIEYLSSRGQSIKVLSLIYRRAIKEDYLMPVMDVIDNDRTFEGGFVMEPKKGFYANPIAVLDFSSLYPSIMIVNNLCYTTLVEKNLARKILSNKINLKGINNEENRNKNENNKDNENLKNGDVNKNNEDNENKDYKNNEDCKKEDFKNKDNENENNDSIKILEENKSDITNDTSQIIDDITKGKGQLEKTKSQILKGNVTNENNVSHNKLPNHINLTNENNSLPDKSSISHNNYIRELKADDLIETPTGNYFVKKDIKDGLLPRILADLISERKKAKQQLKSATTLELRASLNARQLALKVSANSVYGFTGATIGKLPCLEISQSTTGFGRDMIALTKTLIEQKYCKNNGYDYDAIVIYGDTDSVMINYKLEDLNKVFEISKEISKYVSEHFVKPISLEFEKVYYPYLLMNKKRYAGLVYTNTEGADKIDTKGIETVRRDNCEMVRDLIETCLDLILNKKDIESAKTYVKDVVRNLHMNSVDLSQLIISKSLTKTGEKYQSKQAHVELAEKLRKRDEGTAPSLGDRVGYIIVKGARNSPIYDRAEDPIYVLDNNLPIDIDYYLENQLAKPVARLFEPIMSNVSELLRGDHTRNVKQNMPTKTPLGMFFTQQVTCINCRCVGKILCDSCNKDFVKHYVNFQKELDEKRTVYAKCWVECQRCQGSLFNKVLCVNSVCPIFFMRTKVKNDLKEMDKKDELLKKLDW